MERQQILDVVIKHLRRNVDGLDNVEIDPAKSMAEYSASSLDIVEVVSASMRELKIKIPRTRLADVKNMNGLVDLFYQVKNAAPDVQPVAQA
jgi:polyketide biosynthesis acyl carrier protein